MKQITIGFSTNTMFFSRLIMWAENTPFSHVYVHMNWTTTGQDVVYQASSLKVNTELMSVFETEETVVQEFNITISDAKQQKMLDYMKANLGKSYSVMSIVALAGMLLMRKLGLRVTNPSRLGHTTFICSEIGDDLLSIAENQPIENRIQTPLDLYTKLKDLHDVSA